MNRLFVVTAWILGGSVLTLAQPGQAAAKSQDGNIPWVLRKAIKAGPGLRYFGTRTIEFRRDGQTFKHAEIVTRDGANIRIEFSPGAKYAGQIIVETAKERQIGRASCRERVEDAAVALAVNEEEGDSEVYF